METLIHVAYLVASVLFILGLKRLANIRKSREGNALAAAAMALAMIAALIDIGTVDYTFILAGIVVGSLIGAVAALRVEMTAMPQMVAIFNGMGGGGSLLVGISHFWGNVGDGTGPMAGTLGSDVGITLVLSVIVGSVTLSGSLIAFAKLQEVITGRPVQFAGQKAFNGLVLVASLVIGAWLLYVGGGPGAGQSALIATAVLTLVLGVTLVLPIGGADMPVVISLLNSYSGVAASMTGFVLQNNLLIIAGAFVGAAGLILTQIMCKAMNRSLANVLFGGVGAEISGGGGEYTSVKEAGAEEAAMILESVSSVIVVPGYGLAVAQAQHVIREMAEILESNGCTVRYGIHPVAGRMPGHMNVLLAEANVPYDRLVEMDQINGDFKNTEAVMVVGANDVVNPGALHDDSSPIYGMPILMVHEAQTVFVLKRSLAAGFAGIKNELFEAPNTLMVYGDAKKTITKVVEELKAS
ncbi:MAG: NAD synthetase [Gemmatimonadetes bacterium]|nr:NAD synthetase [Gemmatimonadota bacterium]